jgi:hypothetical protein
MTQCCCCCCCLLLLQAYSNGVSYFPESGQLIAKGPFPLITQCLQGTAELEASLLGSSSSSSIVPWLTLERGIVPADVLVQKAR